ncbi:MAG TPA: hypothetical protein VN667_21860 [Burkholderiales bacterium]|nr:hypothetical protein [Burkholderiales bacterium]
MYRIHRAFYTFLTAAALALSAQAAMAQAADVGLVNLLSGDVSYAGQGGGNSKAQAFMKVRQGDRFTVPAGASVRVVYFDGGRQETWKGPAAFKAGAKSSDATSGTPEVATLPSAVPQRIAQVPELIQIAKLGRSGGVAIRGGNAAPALTADQKAEVAAAKDTYRRMRAQAAADDINPELYLYSVLQDYLLYDDMKPVVDEMAKRQPASEDVQALASWVKSRTQ